MKREGMVVFIVGLLLTLFTVFNFTLKEKVVDVGKVEIFRDKKYDLSWSPLIGVAVMVVGVGLYIYKPKNQ